MQPLPSAQAGFEPGGPVLFVPHQIVPLRELHGKSPLAVPEQTKTTSLPAGHMWKASIGASRKLTKSLKKTEKRKSEAAETAGALAELPTGARIISTRRA